MTRLEMEDDGNVVDGIPKPRDIEDEQTVIPTVKDP